MSTYASPNPVPEKAYSNPPEAAQKDAVVDAKIDTLNIEQRSCDNLKLNAGSVEPLSEMYLKPFEELSNPQGYSFFSPF